MEEWTKEGEEEEEEEEEKYGVSCLTCKDDAIGCVRKELRVG